VYGLQPATTAVLSYAVTLSAQRAGAPHYAIILTLSPVEWEGPRLTPLPLQLPLQLQLQLQLQLLTTNH
jgi:hypothetical protein